MNRLIGLAVVLLLTIGVVAVTSYARSLSRRELRRALARRGDVALFEGRMAAVDLDVIGERDAIGVTDVVVAVDPSGVTVYTSHDKRPVTVPFTRIASVGAPSEVEPGTVLFELGGPPGEVSLRLCGRFFWGALPATPSATRRFVDAVRNHPGAGSDPAHENSSGRERQQ